MAKGNKDLNFDGDLKSLSDEDFMKEWDTFSAHAGKVRERLVEFNREHQERARLEQLRALDIGPDDVALLQEIQAEGIESQEAVGQVSRNG